MRLIRRFHPELTAIAIVGALTTGKVVGYDSRGNRKVSFEIEGIALIAVVDEDDGVIVTLWREE